MSDRAHRPDIADNAGRKAPKCTCVLIATLLLSSAAASNFMFTEENTSFNYTTARGHHFHVRFTPEARTFSVYVDGAYALDMSLPERNYADQFIGTELVRHLHIPPNRRIRLNAGNGRRLTLSLSSARPGTSRR